MNTNRITIWPTPYVKGWTGEGAPDALPSKDIGTALDIRYSTDAHFVPYVLHGAPGTPRVNKSALDTVRARGWRMAFSVVVLDIDCPEAHREGKAVSEDWRLDQDDLYNDLPDDLLCGMGQYDTRGGYRLVWRLPRELDVEEYVSWCAALRAEVAKHGIVADPLKDWGRCYRLPFVVRDGVRQEHDRDLSRMDEPMRWTPPTRTWQEEAIDQLFERGERGERARPDASRPITENRNTELTRLAGAWRRTGLDKEQIKALLVDTNEKRCEPPLELDELEKIAASITRYDPEPVTPAAEPGGDEPPAARPAGPRFTLGSEEEIARGVSADMEDGATPIVYDRSKLWTYTAPVWTEVELDRVSRIIQDYDGELIFKGVNKDGEPKYQPLKISASFVRGATTLLCARKSKTGWFDDAPHGLMFENRFVQVDDHGTIHEIEPSPDLRQEHLLPFPFVGGSRPEQFLAMLRGCWRDDQDCADKIELLREWVGAALLGQSPRYQQALILSGSGANGKSKVGDIISALFPEGTVTSVAPQDMESEYRRALLAGARLNNVSEMPEADILVSEPVKAMISGEAIMGRHIREAPFEFRPRVAHLFAANTLPAVRDMSRGFWRRWLVLEFGREFKAHEADRTIAERIIESELQDIACWAVEGAARLAARGHYAEPASSTKALAKWRVEADQVATFVESMCVDCDQGSGARDLYEHYAIWAQEAGHRRVTQTKFGRRLGRLGIPKMKRRAGLVYGIRFTRK